jgi:hypothetical protein
VEENHPDANSGRHLKGGEVRKGLKNFEIQVIEILAAGFLSNDAIVVLTSPSTSANYEYTGCGYFLTIRDSALPAEKRTLSIPTLIGSLGDVVCGFVVYVDEHELTLEVHDWGTLHVTKDYRDGDVIIRPALDSEVIR